MNGASYTKQLGKQDVHLFQQLILLFSEVFEMQELTIPGESYLLKLLENPDFLAYVVISENKIAGGLTAYKLASYYNEGAEIYIYDMAVKTQFQRQGLGKQLIFSLKEYCRQNNIQVMFVEANVEDENAVEFYRTTGGNAESVTHFNYYLTK